MSNRRERRARLQPRPALVLRTVTPEMPSADRKIVRLEELPSNVVIPDAVKAEIAKGVFAFETAPKPSLKRGQRLKISRLRRRGVLDRMADQDALRRLLQGTGTEQAGNVNDPKEKRDHQRKHYRPEDILTPHGFQV